jgi:hypothetical protein
MRPCRFYRRPTPRAALVEAHLRPPPHARELLGADRVVWICPGCAGRPGDQP